jgi:hypothetical protein
MVQELSATEGQSTAVKKPHQEYQLSLVARLKASLQPVHRNNKHHNHYTQLEYQEILVSSKVRLLSGKHTTRQQHTCS